MAKNKPVHVEVVARRNESSERLIKRFLKKTKNMRLMDEFFKYSFYEKPSAKRRKKSKARAEVLRKLKMELQERMSKTAKRTNYGKKRRKKGQGLKNERSTSI